MFCAQWSAISYLLPKERQVFHLCGSPAFSVCLSLVPSQVCWTDMVERVFTCSIMSRGTSWPPAPSSILPASLSRVPPYPSHLLISLLNSRRQRGSGRGEMDGPGEGVEGPGRESWGGRSSGLLQPPCQAGAKLSGTGVGRPGR